MDPVNDKSTCAPYDRRSTPELSPRKRTEIFNPIHWLLPVSSIALIDTYEKLRFEQDIQEHYRRPWNWLRRLWNKVFNGEIWLACRVSFKERASSLEIENFTKTALTTRSVRSENDQFAFKLSSASQPRTRSEPASLCSSKGNGIAFDVLSWFRCLLLESRQSQSQDVGIPGPHATRRITA